MITENDVRFTSANGSNFISISDNGIFIGGNISLIGNTSIQGNVNCVGPLLCLTPPVVAGIPMMVP